MKLLAFQGFRYQATDDRDAGALAAPPFDQIDDEKRRQLHALSPQHYSHLTRPDPKQDDPQAAARALHERWSAEGVVVRDSEPALYPYVVELTDGRRRPGICGLLSIAPGVDHGLRPHEHTVDKPLADRLALLEAMQIDIEPVFVIADDKDGELDRLLAEDLETLEEIVSHTDPATGERHVLYHLDDAERIKLYQEVFAAGGAAIADGHHRTKTAQLYAKKHSCDDGTAAGAKMAVITPSSAEGVAIDPIHRAVMVELDENRLESLTISRTSAVSTNGHDLAAEVAASDQPAIGVWFAGGSPEIWSLDPKRVPDSTPGRKAGLSVVLLHYQLLAASGLDISNASDGTILYRSNPNDLYDMVNTGEAKAGFWLPPMSAQGFAQATEDGDVLPPKSTRFIPKLVSGLVWCGHDAETR